MPLEPNALNDQELEQVAGGRPRPKRKHPRSTTTPIKAAPELSEIPIVYVTSAVGTPAVSDAFIDIPTDSEVDNLN